MKETNPTGYYPKRADRLYLNHSRCSTSCRSGVVDPSLESFESLRKAHPPIAGTTHCQGALLEIGQAPNFSPFGDFGQGARPLARFRFSGASVFLEAFFLLSPTTLIPFTSSDSFPSYST